MLEFWTDYVWPVVVVLAQSVLLLVILLIAVAYIIYADRKIWAAVQIRRGPNVVGPWGLLQSFADLIKFAVKEPVIPSGANKGIFLLAPFVSPIDDFYMTNPIVRASAVMAECSVIAEGSAAQTAAE